MIELLVVIAIIAILAGLVLPALARAKQKAILINCISNYKQMGLAIQMYADDNEGFLPGRVWASAMASYEKGNDKEIAYYVAPYLSYPSPGPKPVVAEILVCPGYRRVISASLIHRKCFLLNDDVDANPGPLRPPFGYPLPLPGYTEAPLPLLHSSIANYGDPSEIFAAKDVDQYHVPNPDWGSDLPEKPVHGQVESRLFFDWHVAAVRVD